MSSPVIIVESLGKRYRIRHQQQGGLRYKALRDILADKARSAGCRLWSLAKLSINKYQVPTGPKVEDFWALKNVSFEINVGDVVGIIGRNGAGKSTLLKVLSRITEPTEGRVRIQGRVASLLEVGTGFHPELTGRENIFLNGAILGMTRAEIRGKFDEIVAFAEVERFLDTPVKRYSSGMYVRLAFAVAAHLEPEILVVDEVLAVGDAEFQKKCLGKMQEVSTKGRTVLFVSHNMAAVQKLCTRGIVLDRGSLAFAGTVPDAMVAYSGRLKHQSEVLFEARTDKPSIVGVKINSKALAAGDMEIEISYRSPFPLNPPVPGVVITSVSGIPVFGSNPRFHRYSPNGVSLSCGTVRFSAKRLPLISGAYRISVWLGDWQADYDQKLDVLAFEFRPEATVSLRPGPEIVGHLDWDAEWHIS